MKSSLLPLSSSSIVAFAALCVLAVLGAGCPPPASEGEGEGEGEGEPGVQCTEPSEVACRDQSFAALSMNLDTANAGTVETTADGAGFASHVDATAGGFGGDGGFVYAKFTETGLEKVDLLDDESFESMDWDLAFRRFVIRLNSGMGGPSCVTAARTTSTDYDAVTATPANLEFNEEQFMTADCSAVIADGSGLPDAPSTVLHGFWSYAPASCLQMTDVVYVVRLQDGRDVKLVVTSYYDPAAQDECDETGSNDASGSANIRFRWAFL